MTVLRTTTAHRWLSLLGLLVAVLALVRTAAAAEFTNSFNDIVAGATLALTWDDVPRESYPLALTAQVIERTGDGGRVNLFQMNVTYIASGNSFKWEMAPYPLRYVSGGIYRVELRPSMWVGEGVAPVVAKSPVFNMADLKGTKTNGGTAPTLIDYQSGGAPGINRPLAIGLGVAIGIPSVVALGIVSWCFRRRQRRAAVEKRRRRRNEFIIN